MLPKSVIPRREFIRTTTAAIAGATLAGFARGSESPAHNAARTAQSARPSTTQAVWCDLEGLGRNVFVHFRLAVRLAEPPARAQLHLFADTRYRLRVNGAIVSCGPAAFLVAYPEFDTIDVASWLHAGDNEIAVEVNARGEISYQAEPSRGGFIAWGFAHASGGATLADFSTPGDWQARRVDAWAPGSPAFSFAQGPVEIVDLAHLPADGRVVDSNAAGWGTPIVVPAPVRWENFAPRSVPPPALDLWSPQKIVTLAPLASRQTYASVHRRTLSSGRPDARPQVFAYTLWLHSPDARGIELSISPGTHWLNGELLSASDAPTRESENIFSTALRAGSNLLYGELDVRGRASGLIVAWPRDSGLRASSHPDETNSSLPFQLTEAMSRDALHRLRGAPPANATALARFGDALKPAIDIGATAFPSREVVWDEIAARPILTDPTHFADRELPRGEGGEAVAVLDFGREFIGHVMLELNAPEGGIVDVTNEELLRADGCVRMFTRINPVDRLHLRRGINHWEGFHARGGRYIQLSVRSTGPVTLRRIQLRNALVPVPVSGTFECSDPVLNWAWDAGVATLEASLTDGWIDPWREQGLYIGDALVQYLAHRAWTRDTSHIVRALRMWARAQLPDGQLQPVVPSPHYRPHPDYTLIWIIMLRDYARHTGDVALVNELWPCVERIWKSPLWHPGPRGLWNSDGLNVFGDWGATQEATAGQANGILNAFRVGALDATSELSDLCGNSNRAATYRRERDRVAEAYRTVLWDPAKNAFAPCLRDGAFVETSAAHANALALRYGIATPAQLPGALAVVRDRLAAAAADPMRCNRRGGHFELYFLHFVMELLGERGLHEEAENVIRIFWGMQRDRGAWTVWEAFYRGLRGMESQCHGWATGPNVYFHRTVLGIDATAERVLIAPCAASLSHARGVYPHPRGDISVAWRVEGGDFHLDVELPQGLAHDAHPGATFAHLRPRVNVRTRSG